MTSKEQSLANAMKSSLKSWDAAPFLEKFVGIAPSIIYVFNQLTQSNEYSNRSIGATLGYSEQEILEFGASLMPSLIHPEDLATVGKHLHQITTLDDGEVISLEYRMKHKAGNWVWLLGYDTVFERNDDGSVLRHIGVATDITIQKTAEAKARAETRVAENANEELRSFAYAVSHDMKAPSNTLDMLFNELKMTLDDTDTEAAQLVDLGTSTVKRMQVLIEDVLNYTRIIGETVAFEPVQLGPLVADILGDFEAEIRQAGARITVGDLPDVYGSTTHCRILLQNLIGNALKFRAQGVTPEITIAGTEATSDQVVAITVSDNGIGIPKGEQGRIFGMFKRLHNETDYPGTGLGLALCRRVAFSQGGDISLNSEEGEGAAFTVTFVKP